MERLCFLLRYSNKDNPVADAGLAPQRIGHIVFAFLELELVDLNTLSFATVFEALNKVFAMGSRVC